MPVDNAQAELSIERLKALSGKVLIPFIAPPNGGKGTQTQILCEKYNLPKIDMGSMLRALGKLDTPLAQRVRELQANGQLVDTPTVLNVLEDGLVRLLDDRPDTPGFILDGFPRNREQAEGLFELCQRTGAKIGKAVYLSVPNEAIVERAANRRMCSVTGKIYNIQTITDAERQECERLGGVLEHRNDDKPEMVQRRLDSFDADTKPILAMFEQAGVLVEVNGHRAINEITQELEGIVTNALSSRQA